MADLPVDLSAHTAREFEMEFERLRLVTAKAIAREINAGTALQAALVEKRAAELACLEARNAFFRFVSRKGGFLDPRLDGCGSSVTALPAEGRTSA